MSRIAAGFAEGAEQGQELSGKERDGGTAAGAAGGADAAYSARWTMR